MSIRFSEGGPAFPNQLVDALLAGEVVFLCGAGVSAPQLPQFPDLVRGCFHQLRVAMRNSENESFIAWRYEEVLGSLSRRVVDPDEVVKAVTNQLRVPANVQLGNHKTILRLSKDLSNASVIVTTNFDTLFERAMLDSCDKHTVQRQSFAGQDLPAPGSTGFGGIVHLHGRIDDDTVGLDATSLVLTSAQYGDAYMRSGWASRFLFDLCRCKTIVLVGYRAGDSPVRYFLNVLDADRTRFPDLRQVYALDGVPILGKATGTWEALAVEPVFYEVAVADGGARDHSVLWADLARLADLVERPRATRQAWVRELLAKPCAGCTDAELERVDWAFKGRSDLWGMAAATINDSAWFEFFDSRKLWVADHGPKTLAMWISRDWSSVRRFNCALKWRESLGEALLEQLENFLLQSASPPRDVWLRVWRLLLTSSTYVAHSYRMSYVLPRTFEQPVVLHAHLVEAVACLAPVLELSAVQDGTSAGSSPYIPTDVDEVVMVNWRVPEDDECRRLMDALDARFPPLQVLNAATSELQAFTALAQQCGQIVDDHDISEYAVPSVEPHSQNEHLGGPSFLVHLLVRALAKTILSEPAAARAVAETWRFLPGSLGVRLWLHALRSAELYSGDSAVEGVLSLPPEMFWRLRRELALAIRDRVADASRVLVAALEARVLTEGLDFFQSDDLEVGETDWHSDALDAAVWLRLEMLLSAGPLGEKASMELRAIKGRHSHLDRPIEDRDFFSSYSTGLRIMKPTQDSLLDASDGDRLDVALQIAASRDVRERHGWSFFCRSKPELAFETLASALPSPPNIPLWRDFINAIGVVDPAKLEQVLDLKSRTFDVLTDADDDFLRAIVSPLTILYRNTKGRTEKAVEVWWPRLFRAAAMDNRPFAPVQTTASAAMNSASGRMVDSLLLDIQALGDVVSGRLEPLLMCAASGTGLQGALARATLLASAGFVVTVGNDQIVARLIESMEGDGDEARALRQVLLCESKGSIAASRAFRLQLLQGLSEFRGNSSSAITAASKFLAPVWSTIRNAHGPSPWGLDELDAAQTLQTCSASIRAGTAFLLKKWIALGDEDRALNWERIVDPLLKKIWPREKTLYDAATTRHLAGLIVSADAAFPEALQRLSPYLIADDSLVSFAELESTTIPSRFPRETLELLWRLFGHPAQSTSPRLGNLLVLLTEACPDLELDRRLQWLDQRSV